MLRSLQQRQLQEKRSDLLPDFELQISVNFIVHEGSLALIYTESTVVGCLASHQGET